MCNNAKYEKLLNKMEEIINSDFHLSRMLHKQSGNTSYYDAEYLLSCVFHTWMIHKDIAMNQDDFLKYLFIEYNLDISIPDFLEIAKNRICLMVETEARSAR